jgi:hypothetical protein
MDQDFTVDDVLEDVGLQILGSERIANFMDRWGYRLVRLGRRPRRGQTRWGLLQIVGGGGEEASERGQWARSERSLSMWIGEEVQVMSWCEVTMRGPRSNRTAPSVESPSSVCSAVGRPSSKKGLRDVRPVALKGLAQRRRCG